MKTMTHITLNTGHAIQQPRVHASVIAALRPLVTRNGGRIPYCPAYSVRMAHDDGAAAFTIIYGEKPTAPVISCVVCWRPDAATRAWASAEKSYLDLSDSFAEAMGAEATPVMPSETPWLAVVLLPTFAATPEHVAALSWLPDFENCMAWALIATAQR